MSGQKGAISCQATNEQMVHRLDRTKFKSGRNGSCRCQVKWVQLDASQAKMDHVGVKLK